MASENKSRGKHHLPTASSKENPVLRLVHRHLLLPGCYHGSFSALGMGAPSPSMLVLLNILISLLLT